MPAEHEVRRALKLYPKTSSTSTKDYNQMKSTDFSSFLGKPLKHTLRLRRLHMILSLPEGQNGSDLNLLVLILCPLSKFIYRTYN